MKALTNRKWKSSEERGDPDRDVDRDRDTGRDRESDRQVVLRRD